MFIGNKQNIEFSFKGERLWRFNILILFVIIPLQLDVRVIENGLNQSWVYAENWLVGSSFLYGKDVFWPWGPLGFLFHVNNVGNNLIYAIMFWVVCYGIYVFLISKFVFDSHYSKKILLISAVFLFLSQIKPEYFLFYIFMLSIIHLCKGKKRYVYISLMLFVVMFFIKFTLAMMAAGTLFVYLLLSFFSNRENFKWMLRIFMMSIVSIPALYLVYNFNLYDFVEYVKCAMEISSGYNAALSLNYYDSYWIYAVIMVILYLVLLSIECYYRKMQGLYLLTLAPAFFMVYKHGFVRADEHIEITLSGVLWIVSLICLIFNEKPYIEKSLERILFIAIVGGMASVPLLLYEDSIKSSVVRVEENLSEIMFDVKNVMEAPVKEDIKGIPEEFINIIGDDTVTIYGYEISALVGSDLNYIPMYFLQIYESYTPEMDAKSASMFYTEDAPEYIIFSLDTMDGRLPVIEVPKTWRAICNHYYACALLDSSLLLKKSDRIYDDEIAWEKAFTKENGKLIEVDDEFDLLSISVEKNLLGKVASFLWKIPEVRAKVCYDDGTVCEGRVILENLEGGILINYFPTSYGEVVNVLNEPEFYNKKIESICFSGEALQFYKDFEIKYGNVKGERVNSSYCCEVIYTQISDKLKNYTRQESDIVTSMESCQKSTCGIEIRGWAFIENKETDIFFECDGNIYSTNSIHRQDVLNVFGLMGMDASKVGYSCLLPNTDNLKILLVNEEEQSIYEKQIW